MSLKNSMCIIMVEILCILTLNSCVKNTIPDTNSTINNSVFKNNELEQYVFLDYPLIEICFSETDNWSLVVFENVYDTNSKIYINSNENSLNFNKEKLVVNTYPAGRGTTPNHLILLLKNDIVVKEVFCLEYNLYDLEFFNDFSVLSEVERDEYRQKFLLQ